MRQRPTSGEFHRQGYICKRHSKKLLRIVDRLKAQRKFLAFRVLFGLTAREVTSRLTTIGKEHKTSLAEYATEVKGLVWLACPNLLAIHRRRIGLDTFHMTLGNAYLQRHLLAVGPDSLEEAVRADQIKQVKGNLPNP